MMDVLKVGIIGTSRLIRNALYSLLLSFALPAAVCLTVDAETVLGASQQIASSRPHILAIDAGHPSFCLPWIQVVKSLSPATKCLLLADNAEGEIAIRAAQSGAWGVLSKEASRSLAQKAVQTLMDGHMWFSQGVVTSALRRQGGTTRSEVSLLEQLTPRETEILTLLAKGFHNKEIAHQLFISENTVKTYVKAIYQKLGVTSRVEVVQLVADRSMLTTSLARSNL